MTVPVWMLLGFAAWTVLLLAATIGVYRWSRILTGRARISEFRADGAGEEDWYRRATRAHANCIENLPVFGAIVFALQVSGIDNPAVDGLSSPFWSRGYSVSPCVFVNQFGSLGSSFYSVQLVSFIALIALVAAAGQQHILNENGTPPEE
jgi:uncharacterized MAPEG superfamily protein